MPQTLPEVRSHSTSATNPARDDPFATPATGQFAMLGLLYSRTEKMDFDIALRRGLNGAEPDDVILAGATLRW